MALHWYTPPSLRVRFVIVRLCSATLMAYRELPVVVKTVSQVSEPNGRNDHSMSRVTGLASKWQVIVTSEWMGSVCVWGSPSTTVGGPM